ncbi:MAG: hypothetical protein IJT31_08290, partial [Oscillibacter sp.]|nr:hypothetical protein [Oscillibacter sp.]
ASPPAGDSSPDRSGGGGAALITPEDIARGWRPGGVATNGAVSYAMPPNGVGYARWSLRGGRETSFALDLGGFSFPAGTGFVHRLEVLSGGAVESLPRNDQPLFSAVAARERASLVPGASRFWTAEAEGGAARLLTWENVYAGRDGTGQYSAQVELRANGDFATRSNGVERVFLRVPPFDWDGDGLENSVDPDPLAAGPDAHGTNAEWYNTVCSNVFLAAESPDGGVALTPRSPEVHTNAYYFVDVVASNGPAPVWFLAGRASRLGSPVVVALAGATNRVPLLVGIEYAVTSTVPFGFSVPGDCPHALVEPVDPRAALVRWPLDFVFAESVGASNRAYSVTVEPYDPGGVLELGGSGGVPMRGGTPGGGCGCLSYGDSNIVWFACSRSCTCGSACAAEGTYLLENALFAVAGGQCRCGFDDPPELGQGSVTNQPFLSVSFSSPTVIFEDAYMTAPNKWREKRSTRVRMTVHADGGPHGGMLALSTANLEKLVPVGCGPLLLPSVIVLEENETYSVSFICEGNLKSSVKDDILVSGIFTENGTDETICSVAKLTVIRIELRPKNTALENPCLNRHTFGVDESVICIQEPALPQVEWIATGSGIVTNLPAMCYICPIRAENGGLSAALGTVTYSPIIDVVEPTELVCTAYGFLPADPAMGVGMALELRVCPLDVSFEGLRLQEVPAPSTATSPEWGEHDGYFSNLVYRARWYHYAYWGAGIWISILPGNKFGQYDQSRMFVWPQPWRTGRLTWEIPIAWKSKHSSSLYPDGELALVYLSEWTMTDTAVRKEKHLQELIFTAEGEAFLNGEHYGAPSKAR